MKENQGWLFFLTWPTGEKKKKKIVISWETNTAKDNFTNTEHLSNCFAYISYILSEFHHFCVFTLTIHQFSLCLNSIYCSKFNSDGTSSTCSINMSIWSKLSLPITIILFYALLTKLITFLFFLFFIIFEAMSTRDEIVIYITN